MLSKETLATIGILIVFIFIASTLYKPLFENPETVFREAPLEKNKQLQLFAGETYVYAYMLNGSQINMTYIVYDSPYCTKIRLIESENLTESCLDNWGLDSKGYNATLENQQMILFKPWMLALKDGWKWNNTMYISYNGIPYPIATSEYRVVRTEEFMNRTAFVVEIKAGSSLEYNWIDMEKRVLLKTSGEGYEVILANYTEGN